MDRFIFTDKSDNKYEIWFQEDSDKEFIEHVYICKITEIYGCRIVTNYSRLINPDTHTIIWGDCAMLPWATEEAVNYINKLYKNRVFL